MNIKLEFDPDKLKDAMMEEAGITDTTLSHVFSGDQMRAEVEETAGKVAMFYQTLVVAGMSKKYAAERAATYCDLLLAQHFGIPTMNLAELSEWED